jgi:hypothetical protein
MQFSKENARNQIIPSVAGNGGQISHRNPKQKKVKFETDFKSWKSGKKLHGVCEKQSQKRTKWFGRACFTTFFLKDGLRKTNAREIQIFE